MLRNLDLIIRKLIHNLKQRLGFIYVNNESVGRVSADETIQGIILHIRSGKAGTIVISNIDRPYGFTETMRINLSRDRFEQASDKRSSDLCR